MPRLSVLALCILLPVVPAAAECVNEAVSYEANLALCGMSLGSATDPAERAALLADRGRLHLSHGDLDAAEADLRAAIDLAPDQAAGALAHLSWLHGRRGEVGEALDAATRAYALDPADAAVLDSFAWALRASGDFAGCIAHAEEGIAAYPDLPAFPSAAASCLLDLGRAEEALARLEEALARGQDPIWVEESRASAFVTLGRPEEGAAAAKAALKADPSRAFALKMLLAARLDQGRTGEAVALYDALSPAVATEALRAEHVWNQMAWDLFTAGDLEEARRFSNLWAAAAPDPRPDEANDLDTRAHILAAQGDSKGAARDFIAALRLGGPDFETYYRERLAALGFTPGPGSAAVEVALRDCARRGADCRLY
jgi:tetratricopeptide (TPR) repeat protein